MAVAYISKETLYQSSAASSNFTISVPADAEAIIVCFAGYNQGGTEFCDELNLANNSTLDFTKVVSEIYNYSGATDDNASAAYILTSADGAWDISATTIYYSVSGTVFEGSSVQVFYVKGLDTADPTGAIDSQDGTPDLSSWTSGLGSVGVGDMSIISTYDYVNVGDITPTGAGQTEIVQGSVFNSDSLAVAYELGESAMEVTGSLLVPIAFVINAAPVVSLDIVIFRRRIEG